MFYQVQQVRVDRRNRRLYLLIHFWRTRAAFELGRPPVLINDFILGLSKERIREEIRDIILGYWRRWRDILPPGTGHSHVDATIPVDPVDPDLTEFSVLEGTTREVAAE